MSHRVSKERKRREIVGFVIDATSLRAHCPAQLSWSLVSSSSGTVAKLQSKALCFQPLRPRYHIVESGEVGIVTDNLFARDGGMHHSNKEYTITLVGSLLGR